jgi:hypothetical protein
MSQSSFGEALARLWPGGDAGIPGLARTPTLDGPDAFACGGIAPAIRADFGPLRLRPMTAPAGFYARGIQSCSGKF